MRHLLPALLLAACAQPPPVVAALTPDPPPPSSLDVLAPEPGSWTEALDVEVRATTEHVSELRVDGLAVAAAGDSWATTVTVAPGIHTFDVVAQGSDGIEHSEAVSVLAGETTPAHARVESGLAVRMSREGLDVFAGNAAALYPEEAVRAALISGPVYTSSLVDVHILGFEFSDVSADITPSDGEVAVTVTLEDVAVEIYLNTLFDFQSTLHIDQVRGFGIIGLGVDGGLPALSLPDPIVTFIGADWSLLPDWDWVEDIVGGVLGDNLEDLFREQVPAIAMELTLELGTLVGVDLLGVTLRPDARFVEVTADVDGIGAVLDLAIQADNDPVHLGPGYLRAPAPPEPPSRDAHFSLVLSDDLINQGVYTAWAAGALDITLSTLDGSLEPDALSEFGLEQGTLLITPGLPPVVAGGGDASTFQLGEIVTRLDGTADGTPMGATVAIAAEVPVAPRVAHSELAVEVGVPTLHLGVRETSFHFGEDTLERMIDRALPVDDVLALIADLRIPLPSLGGLVVVDAVGRRGEASNVFDLTLAVPR